MADVRGSYLVTGLSPNSFSCNEFQMPYVRGSYLLTRLLSDSFSCNGSGEGGPEGEPQSCLMSGPAETRCPAMGLQGTT
jgi:hypothetical protein